MKPYEMYLEIGEGIEEAVQSQLFGKPCFKVNKKPFICFYENTMVFKLNGAMHTEALSLDGTTLFDPSKKNRPMKEWVLVPAAYSGQWERFARAAFNYVKDLPV